ncbi:hypothetical protein MPSI1_003571 [Malassezia psittaci]|uniref:Uncharacterized protein n=1 Tax=Malassezia psittaci TaxID=1821823 RepID=A0AAF0F923_9BASI|nr:hypothetical protein MPSI1_003571 [Malassezia psittaci]
MSGMYRDPWAKREAWRKHPVFSKLFYMRNMFPGLGLGSSAFVAYLIYEHFSARKQQALQH